MWRYAIQMSLKALLPKAVETAWDWLISKPAKEVVITHSRKKPDRTKLTEMQEDFIWEYHKRWVNKELPIGNTQKDLVNWLNKELDLNKGITAYAKIWSPKNPEESK